MTSLILSKGSIRDFFGLEMKIEKSINVVMQILGLTLTDKKHDRILYTCKLSDSQYLYQGFVIIKENNLSECEVKDIIKITSIMHHVLRGNHVFLIKNYEIVKKCAEFIGNPVVFVYAHKEESCKIIETSGNEQFIPLK